MVLLIGVVDRRFRERGDRMLHFGAEHDTVSGTAAARVMCVETMRDFRVAQCERIRPVPPASSIVTMPYHLPPSRLRLDHIENVIQEFMRALSLDPQ